MRRGRDALVDLGDVRPPAATLLDEALASRAVDVLHVRGAAYAERAHAKTRWGEASGTGGGLDAAEHVVPRGASCVARSH